jgi:hypothetical protein
VTGDIDPSIQTEVEVRFNKEGAFTRVELEHRRLHNYGEKAAEMRGIFRFAARLGAASRSVRQPCFA